jgi:hypothetical protein
VKENELDSLFCIRIPGITNGGSSCFPLLSGFLGGRRRKIIAKTKTGNEQTGRFPYDQGARISINILKLGILKL